MRDYSVLVRWKGPFPFNDTVNTYHELDEEEAKRIADIYCGHRNSDEVDIVHCVNGDRTFTNIKQRGMRV